MRYRWIAVAIAASAMMGASVALAAVLVWPGGGGETAPAATASNLASAPSSSSVATSRGQLAGTSGCLAAADVYEQVRQAVVEITSTQQGRNPFSPQSQGTGSGIVIDTDGTILTNHHVVAGATNLEVKFADGTAVTAQVVGDDPGNDVAVIRADLSGQSVSRATLGDSDALRVGDPVLAIGNPFELEGTLTAGIVSAKGRTFAPGGAGTRPIRNMIQTDAPVNPGNSGGPLLDCQGKVIGINTALANPTGQDVNVGIAFAVPVNTINRELSDLRAGKTVSHPWLGIASEDITPAVAKDLQLSVQSGVYITIVSPGGPAQRAGVRAAFQSESQAAQSTSLRPGGDVITAVDGQDVASVEQLASYLDAKKKPGDTVTLKVLRDRQEQAIDATLAEWPAS